MAKLSEYTQVVRRQRARNREVLARLEIVIAERKAASILATERLGDALALKWTITDGLVDDEQALEAIAQFEGMVG